MKNYYKTVNDLMSATLEERIDTLLYINNKACEQGLKNIVRSKSSTIDDIKERNIKIGALAKGEAYFHEKDQYYDVIGFLVESECQFHNIRLKTYGFRSIYFSDCDEYAPVDFDDGYSLEATGQIGNGFGDYVEILEVLNSEEEVERCINKHNIDINKYLKESGLCLANKPEKKKKLFNMEASI